MILRSCMLLFVLECLLGIAHILWPQFEWGQGRRSYFNLANRQTLASWLVSSQWLVIGGMALESLRRGLVRTEDREQTGRVGWALGALTALGLSFLEMSRLHHRFEWLGLPQPDVYQRFVLLPGLLILLILCYGFLAPRLRTSRLAQKALVAWAGLTALELFLRGVLGWQGTDGMSSITLIAGMCQMMSGTFLMLALGEFLWSDSLGTVSRTQAAPPGDSVDTHSGSSRSPAGDEDVPDGSSDPPPAEGAASTELPSAQTSRVPEPKTASTWRLFVGVGGVTAIAIFLQIVLFQLLTISADHLTAHGVIAVALMGIAVGGLIGFARSEEGAEVTTAGAALLLPVGVLLAFGASLRLVDSPVLAAIAMGVPFACASVVLTIALARARSHLVYGVDLLGASLGALAVDPMLSLVREEGAILFLAAFAGLISLLFVSLLPQGTRRRWLAATAITATSLLLILASLSVEHDWLNIIRAQVTLRYPQATVLFSRSNLVGRYDVIRRSPTTSSLKTMENGRIIDTIRTKKARDYLLDPRVPHRMLTRLENPSIAILGLSGDAITKTATRISKDVIGLEINPAVVALQRNELQELNGDSYRGIQVQVMDARSFMGLSTRSFDMITLMNAHFAKGSMEGSAANAEYIHTREAYRSYLEHLTDAGFINIEEPINRPNREPAVWRQISTLRAALLEIGAQAPEDHFFIFQWKTRTNNYIELLIKKTPFTQEEVADLHDWLREIDTIRTIGRRLKRWMGPISSITTVLHAPFSEVRSTYSQAASGSLHPALETRYQMTPTTDDRPFPFDLNPARSELHTIYLRALFWLLLLAPFFLVFIRRHRETSSEVLPFFAVVGLTGMGYLLVEVTLIQRLTIYLGVPVLTFSVTLGTLLSFSGLGSLLSGRMNSRAVALAATGALGMVLVHLFGMPLVFQATGDWSTFARVLIVIASLAPLAILMGIPFPYLLRMGKARFSPPSVAILFAFNAAASAVAVPIALYLSASFGLGAMLLIAMGVYLAVALAIYGLKAPGMRRPATVLSFATLIILLLTPLWPTLTHSSAAPPSSGYDVFAASYGQSRFRADKVFENGKRADTVPFEWLFWIIRGHDKVVLVDTGTTDRALIKRWNIRDATPPVDRVRALGIDPSEVTDIVLTHMHWDHAGDLASYPKATIWIQKRELAFARDALRGGIPFARGVSRRDLEALQAAARQGRVVEVDTHGQVAEGLELFLNGDHTPGFQHVQVETAYGKVVIGGDSAYLYENSLRRRATGAARDPEHNLEAIRTMQKAMASPYFLLPGHDPRVIRWFPEIAPGLVEITAPNY